jgi:hypothetical protein
MTPATTSHRATALVLGAVLLAQCLLAPIALARIERTPIVIAGAAITMLALLWAVRRVAEGDRRATAVALAGIPTLLALTSLAAATLPHFDGPARVVAALTGVGYFAAAARACCRASFCTALSSRGLRLSALFQRWHVRRNRSSLDYSF